MSCCVFAGASRRGAASLRPYDIWSGGFFGGRRAAWATRRWGWATRRVAPTIRYDFWGAASLRPNVASLRPTVASLRPNVASLHPNVASLRPTK